MTKKKKGKRVAPKICWMTVNDAAIETRVVDSLMADDIAAEYALELNAYRHEKGLKVVDRLTGQLADLLGLVERTSRKLSRSVGFGADLSGHPGPGLCTIELPFSDCDDDDSDENDFSSLADD